jgi:thiamine-phosphate pyrophosphorylase
MNPIYDYSLYLVTDENISDDNTIFKIVKRAVKGGVTMVQLREKKLSTKDFVEKALELKKILTSLGVPLIINDNVEVALAVKADGIHIGQSDMSFEKVRKLVPESMIVGLSVETIEQAIEAEKYDVNYLGVSPVFSTLTKTNFNEKPWGLEGLKKLKSFSRHKLVAIGGINIENAEDVIKAGADGLAVVSAICSSSNSELAAKQLIEIIKEARDFK